MARPTKEQQPLIEIRNTLIKECVSRFNLSQTDTAYVFRLPRNTVNTVLNNEEISEDTVRGILYSYKAGDTVSAHDFDTLCGVLKKHPNVAEKTGAGVKSISVEKGGYGKVCFYLHRVDGSKVDFSFLKCFGKTSNDFAKAARFSIEPFIESFRKTLPDTFTCPVSGDTITRYTAHIDHVAPLTFKKILTDFIHTHNVVLTEVQYDRSGIGVSFKDEELAHSFITYHNSVAVLRGISAKANLSLPKK